MNASLIHLKRVSFKGEDEKVVDGYIPTFLVEPSDPKKYVPSEVSFWLNANSQMAQIIELGCGTEPLEDGEVLCNVSGLCFCDISYKYDKEKKLQKLKYVRVKEVC